MKFYVMSGNQYATGGRLWTAHKEDAWCFEADHEAAKHHAETFRNPDAQRELRVVHRFQEVPGHKDARVVGFLEE